MCLSIVSSSKIKAFNLICKEVNRSEQHIKNEVFFDNFEWFCVYILSLEHYNSGYILNVAFQT